MSAYRVRLLPSAQTIDCAASQTVLDAGLAAGLPMPYICRSGECGECIAELRSGTVEELPGADPAVFTDDDRGRGRILTCMCLPTDDLEIALALRDGVAAPKVEHVNAMVDDIVWHGRHIAEVRLATPWPLDYRAGQYFEWLLPGIEPNRCFSAANRPGGDTIVFHVRIYPDGRVGRHLTESLLPGHVISVRGPYGHFGFSANRERPAVCVAGGTGMAPIRAVLDQAFASGDPRPIRFFYGARDREHLYCLDDMARWSAAHPSFAFIPVLSEEPAGSPWRGERALVTEVLARDLGDARDSEAYLCGPPAMIDAAIDILRAGGVRSEDIRYDKFTIAK